MSGSPRACHKSIPSRYPKSAFTSFLTSDFVFNNMRAQNVSFYLNYYFKDLSSTFNLNRTYKM